MFQTSPSDKRFIVLNIGWWSIAHRQCGHWCVFGGSSKRGPTISTVREAFSCCGCTHSVNPCLACTYHGDP